jgi:hypothetical protein
MVGRRVEAQREAPGLRDRHDSFIGEADGRDEPVEVKPQAREVPIESDPAVHVEAEGDPGPDICLDLRRPIGCDRAGFRVCLPLDSSSASMQRASLSTWTGSVIVRSTLSSHISACSLNQQISRPKPSASSPFSIMLIPRPCCGKLCWNSSDGLACREGENLAALVVQPIGVSRHHLAPPLHRRHPAVPFEGFGCDE